MRRIPFVCIFFIALLCATALYAVAASPPPFLKLARALGTPVLATSLGTPDKSQLVLKFVVRGESVAHWTKMTTVSIFKVAPNAASGATRDLMTRTRALLASRHVKLVHFDESPDPPTAYFEFEAGAERDSGVIYSPHAGFVTMAQISAKGGGAFSSDDVRTLRSVIGRH